MARGKGEGTITKLDNGSYCGRLTVGYDENGKQKRKAFYGKTKTEVQKKMNTTKAELDRGNYIEPSRMTVSVWLDTWLDEYKKNSIRPSTYYRYKVHLDNDIKPLLGHYKLKDLRNDIVQKFVNDLFSKGRSPATTERAYTILSSALEQAVDNELIFKNSARKIKLPQKNAEESRALTIAEQERFIVCAKEARHGEMFILALGTGMRIGDG